MKPTLSIVVPAHNEAPAIAACLETVVSQQGVHLQVVVVANGCTDATVSIARAAIPRAKRAGHALEVLDLPGSSKPAALNAGDARCPPSARLYLDADARLSPGAAHALAEALAGDTGIHLAAPTLRLSPPQSWFVASYARVWAELPYVREQVLGCGAYAVSADGRRRWGAFPDIASDDRFVRLHFRVDEQQVLDTCTFTVAFPEQPAEFLRTRARWTRGNQQLAKVFPGLADQDTPRVLPAFAHLAAHPELWLHAGPFTFSFAYAHLAARRGRASSTWDRETTSAIRRT